MFSRDISRRNRKREKGTLERKWSDDAAKEKENCSRERKTAGRKTASKHTEPRPCRRSAPRDVSSSYPLNKKKGGERGRKEEENEEPSGSRKGGRPVSAF